MSSFSFLLISWFQLVFFSAHLVHSWSSSVQVALHPNSAPRPRRRPHQQSQPFAMMIPNTWHSVNTVLNSKSGTTSSTTALWSSSINNKNDSNNNQWERDVQEGSRRRVQTGQAGSGAGETVAGAVLGGLLLGPFGALFGASIGSNLGAKKSMDKARQDELQRLGISQDMLDAARDIGVALDRSLEGLQTVQESLDTQQRLARRLDAEASDLYSNARTMLEKGTEDEARTLLLKRTRVQEELKKALQSCALAKKQEAQLQDNAQRLEQRAMEIDSLLRRSSGAKAIQDSSTLSSSSMEDDDFGLSLRDSDPLLRKFKDMGID